MQRASIALACLEAQLFARLVRFAHDSVSDKGREEEQGHSLARADGYVKLAEDGRPRVVAVLAVVKVHLAGTSRQRENKIEKVLFLVSPLETSGICIASKSSISSWREERYE